MYLTKRSCVAAKEPEGLSFDTRFSLESAQSSELQLTELAQNIAKDQRITNTLLNERQAIIIGDFILSRNTNLYTTHSQTVLARCHLPYTNGVAWFEGSEGIAHQQSWVTGLSRLSNIKQLSLLGYPVGQGLHQFSMEFNHTRLVHTYDVYAIGMIIAHNLGIRGKDFTALRLSLLNHDLFTPACGDLMKFVDRVKYDEDERLSQLLEDDHWIQMCRQLGINANEPIRIAQEKDGVLCTIRDFADTLAYVARDLFMFQGMYPAQLSSWYEEPFDQMLEAELRGIESGPTPFDLWQHVHRGENDNLVFDDSDKLHKFLFARACLFRLLYYHRQTRHVEYIIGIRMMKILLNREILKEEDFFGHWGSDSTVLSKVQEETGYSPSGLHDGTLGKTHAFENIEHARTYIGKIVKHNPNVCGLIYTWPSATKSKVGLWSVYKDGKESPFNVAHPEKAERIEGLMKLQNGCFGALINKKRLLYLKPKYWKLLRELSLDVV